MQIFTLTTSCKGLFKFLFHNSLKMSVGFTSRKGHLDVIVSACMEASKLLLEDMGLTHLPAPCKPT